MPNRKISAKLFSLLLVLILCFNLTACSSDSSIASDPAATPAVTPTETPVTEIPVPTSSPTASTPSPTVQDSAVSDDLSEASLRFDDLTNEFFINYATADTLSLHYTIAHPENYGISMDEITLGELSADYIIQGCEENEIFLSQLKTLDYNELTGDRQLSYDCLVTFLEAYNKVTAYTYFNEVVGPTTGMQAQLPILLAEYTFYSADDIDTYIDLVDCVDDYFADVCDFQRDKSANGYFMADQTAESIIDQCEAFIENPDDSVLITVFNDKIDSFEGLTDAQKDDYKERNKNAVLDSVIPAYQLLIDTLSDLKGTAVNQGGLCGFEDGKEYYEALCQYETGSSKTVPEMKQMLNDALTRSMTTLYTIQINTPSIVNQYNNIEFPETDPDKVLEHLKNAMVEDFPVLYDVNYTINYVPDSLKDYLSPAMYLVPPVDDMNNNRIYINDNNNNDMSKIYPTLAHEGYPGHLYQSLYFSHTEPALIRNAVQALGYEEGWANYCELYAYDLSGINSTLAEYMKANTVAVYCIYSLVDIGVHYEGWTVDDVVTYWSNFGYGADIATEIYHDIVAEPASYLPYSIGYLELIALRDKMNEAMGDRFEIMDFHTFYLDTGVARFSVLNDQLDVYIATH